MVWSEAQIRRSQKMSGVSYFILAQNAQQPAGSCVMEKRVFSKVIGIRW